MSNKISIEQEEIMAAYSKLSEGDRFQIDCQARQLEKKLKDIWKQHFHVTQMQFGRVQAIELLAKIGMWQVGGMR